MWQRHYTGIEIYNPRGDGMGWYMHRDTNTKRINFLRWSKRGVNICVFKGYLNHLRMGYNYGLELSLDIRHLPQLRIGVALPSTWNPLWYKLNPRVQAPVRRWFAYERDRWNALAVRFGWVCLGCNLPKRLTAWLDERYMRKAYEAYEAYESPKENQ